MGDRALVLCYVGGLALHVICASGWYEYHRALDDLERMMDRDDWYFVHALLSLAWPVALPALLTVGAVRKLARRRLAKLREQREIDAIIARELEAPAREPHHGGRR